MQRFIYPLLFLTLILSTCGRGEPATLAVPPPGSENTPPSQDLPIKVTEADTNSPALPIPKFITTVSTPHIDQPPDGMIASETPSPPSAYGDCAYMWAYKDLPEISATFQTAVKGIRPEAQANAYVFGEDCVYEDGHRTFSALETDFNVTLAVNDLSDEKTLGDFILAVMKFVTAQFPQGVVPGAQNGFVQFIFTAGEERGGLRVPIDKFNNLPLGLDGAELYNALEINQ